MNDREFKADIFSKTAAEWTSENPYLAKNDLGIETDTGKQKIGVGQKWADTAYVTPSGHTGTATIGSENFVFVNGILTAIQPV